MITKQTSRLQQKQRPSMLKFSSKLILVAVATSVLSVGRTVLDVTVGELSPVVSDTLQFEDSPIISATIDSHTNLSLPSISTKPRRSKVELIFTIGLEGTGHHLMKSIAAESMFMKDIRRLGVSHNLSKLRQLLFRRDPEIDKSGLLLAHCYSSEPDLNLVTKKKKVVRELRKIRDAVEESDLEGTIRIPLNTAPGGGIGMVSYPNFGGQCRKLNFPNLDIIYDVCDAANVDCKHVYIYRNPFEVLRSTTIKRHFNPTHLDAIHLYTSMLQVIIGQLQMHADRTLGCFGFYDAADKQNWWRDVAELWGWKDHAEKFNEVMEDVYRPPSLEARNETFISKKRDKLFMDSFSRVGDFAIQTCKSNLADQA